ncbi:MAG: winged helix-turn-helix transcriptional regulator [Desulfurococcaceae archaeon]
MSVNLEPYDIDIKVFDTFAQLFKNYLFKNISNNNTCSENPCLLNFLLSRRNRFSKSYLNNVIHILILLNKYGRLRLSELSEILNMNPGALHNYVEELCENGFLEIEKNGSRTVYIKSNENTKRALSDLKNIVNGILEIIEKEKNSVVQIYELLNKMVSKE